VYDLPFFSVMNEPFVSLIIQTVIREDFVEIMFANGAAVFTGLCHCFSYLQSNISLHTYFRDLTSDLEKLCCFSLLPPSSPVQ